MIIDACVWLAAYLDHETRHAQCAEFLRHIARHGGAVGAPSLMLAEVAGALARQTRDPERAIITLKAIEANPKLTLYPVTLELARGAAGIASACFVRGADAVYVALARKTKSILITVDNELLERTPLVVKGLTPDAWLRENA